MNNPNLMGGPSQRSYGAISESLVPTVGFTDSSRPELPRALTESITTNIYTITSSLKLLDDTLKALGTRKDNQGIRDKVHVTQLSTNQIISQTTQDLHRLTDLVRGRDKAFKLQVEALRGRFKEAVNTYSSKQKQVAEKMKLCLLPSEVAMEEDEAKGGGGAGAEAEEDLRRIHQQRAAQQEAEFALGMQVERLQRVRQIEADVLDVNEVMRELAAMVVEQEQSVNLIEDSVETAYQRVEGGREQLARAEQYQVKRRNRTIFMCTFAGGLFLIFGVLVYFTLR